MAAFGPGRCESLERFESAHSLECATRAHRGVSTSVRVCRSIGDQYPPLGFCRDHLLVEQIDRDEPVPLRGQDPNPAAAANPVLS